MRCGCRRKSAGQVLVAQLQVGTLREIDAELVQRVAITDEDALGPVTDAGDGQTDKVGELVRGRERAGEQGAGGGGVQQDRAETLAVGFGVECLGGDGGDVERGHVCERFAGVVVVCFVGWGDVEWDQWGGGGWC